MVSLRPLAFLSAFRSSSFLSRRSFVATLSTTSFVTSFTAAQENSCSANNKNLHSTTTNLFSTTSTMDTGYLDAKSAAALDAELMQTPGFTLEQLMELAGLSVAEAVYTVVEEEKQLSKNKNPNILLVCGPGNNGGDGLVAARHLVNFGYDCTIVYPKQSSKQPHYANLVQQCRDVNIDILETMPTKLQDYTVIVDSIFGFSFHGELRPPFDTILQQIKDAQQQQGVLTVAVDVPSGWNVDQGDVSGMGFSPDILVSLTAPKLSAKEFKGRHFVGGRFLPPKLAQKYNVNMPPYPGVAQVMEVTQK